MNEFKIVVAGDNLETENALFISNHLSLVDYIIFPFLTTKTLEEAARQQNNLSGLESPIYAKDLTSFLLPKLQFFTWFQIWNMPSGRFWARISQTDENWELDGQTLGSTFSEYLEQSRGTQWLITFPEVNIFTEKNSKMEQIMGEKYYLPHLEHVLYPRFSGFANCIGGLYKAEFNRIYDTTLVYFQRSKETGKIINFTAPNLLQALGLIEDEIVIIVHIHGKLLNRVRLRRDKLEK
ncbi:hypothetical protein FOA43_000096 [Brettanomyces nanus]|uniref:Uncharacterized protein n=1 Tax=Eeniella nana TaxID=13502 RepID=A0A875S002_EENNA|nr:uncharacterized protein FOA43_000096 [Brettanomyces nanus]QPG72794.1 hypothetical protein FOA43_000096 [Brettanomyces nanus]